MKKIVMDIKQYEELIRLYDSWWDSMPSEMQKKLENFMRRLKVNSI